MSEPSQWGPARFEAAPQPTGPRPTAPYPTAPRPNGNRPLAPHPTGQYPGATEHLPTTPIPTVRQQAPRRPAPSAPPPDRDEYRDDPPEDYSSRRSRRRGQFFAGLVVVFALVVSALMYVLTYQTLASVDITSADPLGGLASQASMLGAVMFGALVVFVLAVIALVIARPKALAALGLAASLLLPVAALVLGLVYGGSVLRQNVEQDIAQAGPEVAAQGASIAADAIMQELQRRGIDPGPLRDLITGVVGQGG
jgi:hypothetical protein